MSDLMQIVVEKKGQPVTTSRKVAEVFEKNHDDVLKSIRILENSLGKISEPNPQVKFELTSYKSRGKMYPEYIMNRDAFSLLVMGFTGEKALSWKLKYIGAFNNMEAFIKSLQTAKLEFPAFTNAIMEAHEEPKHYHFSNEINMINRIVLGMDAKHFKEQHGLDKSIPSIRPYLNTEQIEAIEALQRIDIGLIVAGLDFDNRKRILSGSFSRRGLLASRAS